METVLFRNSDPRHILAFVDDTDIDGKTIVNVLKIAFKNKLQ